MVNLVKRFLHLEAASGIILFCAAVLALLMVNSPWQSIYHIFLELPLQIRFGDLDLHKPLLLWINDGLMAIFFLLVGMEIKREMQEGSLSSWRQASLPVIAAIGGMIFPASFYLLAIGDHSELTSGWAIPMATDIAFALGVLSLLGSRAPTALKVFLLALAIIDDLGAIMVIALVYTEELHFIPLAIAGGLSVILLIANRMRVMHLGVYLLLGVFLWVAVLKSGIHATIAGVILGFAIPHHRANSETPLRRLEHLLHPWSSYFILPVFAFANAGLSFDGLSWSALSGGLPLAIVIGLLLGKPLGVLLTCWAAVKSGVAVLPVNVNWRQISGLSILCGIGFTMSIFIAGLAFNIADPQFELARFGILIGSLLAAVFGYSLLYRTPRVDLVKEQ
jgi:Na+:H+ antiporter, NhaA family